MERKILPKPSPTTRHDESAPDDTKSPTPWDWDSHKEAIRELYVDQNKKLKEVMTTMARDHEFTASANMYKKRIRTWGFHKNLKRNDVVAALHQKTSRNAGEKTAKLTIRGRVIDPKRLQRYVERTGVSSLDGSQAHVSHQIPSLTPLCASPTAPAPFLVQEQFLHACINEMKVWFTEPMFQMIKGMKMGHNTLEVSGTKPGVNTVALWERVFLFKCAVEVGNWDILFQHLDFICNQVKLLLTGGSPNRVYELFGLVAWLQQRNRPELRNVLNKYIAQLADVVLGTRHPIAVQWNRLMHCPDPDIPELISRMLEVFLGEAKTVPWLLVAQLPNSASHWHFNRNNKFDEAPVYMRFRLDNSRGRFEFMPGIRLLPNDTNNTKDSEHVGQDQTRGTGNITKSEVDSLIPDAITDEATAHMILERAMAKWEKGVLNEAEADFLAVIQAPGLGIMTRQYFLRHFEIFLSRTEQTLKAVRVRQELGKIHLEYSTRTTV